MSQPIVGTLPAELQVQAQSSALVTVFEIDVPNSDIGGAGQDKLYFHDGVTYRSCNRSGEYQVVHATR